MEGYVNDLEAQRFIGELRKGKTAKERQGGRWIVQV